MNHTTRHGTSAGFRGPARQRGYATLLVAVVALLLLTIMTLYFSRVAVMDQRMSGNEVRYKEAFSAAMFGLDTSAIALEGLNPTTLPWATPTIDPASFTYSVANSQKQSFDALITRQTDLVGGIYYTVLSAGTSTDGSGSATVSRQYTMERPFSLGTLPAPLVVAGTLNMDGGFEIVANPEGYCKHTNILTDQPLTDKEYCVHPDDSLDSCIGTDQPLAVLAEGLVDAKSSAFASCRPDEMYPGDPNLDGTGCDKAAGLADKKNVTLAPSGTFESRKERPDYGIEGTYAGFPADLFAATFGRSPDAMKAAIPSTHVIKDSECGKAADTEHPDGHIEGDRSDGSVGYWWVTGTGDPQGCKLSGVIGAADSGNGNGIEHDPNGDKDFSDSEIHPVVIVVDEADLTINANTIIYGIVFVLDRSGGTNNVTLSGGATVYGSLLANQDLPANVNGDFVAAYDKRVVCSLIDSQNNPSLLVLSPIQGSWRDF